MAFRDLRQFLGVLEAQGELARVRAEVDWNLELGAVSRRALDLRGPALLFESVTTLPRKRPMELTALTISTAPWPIFLPSMITIRSCVGPKI